MQKCYNLMDRRVEKVKNKRQGGVGEGKKKLWAVAADSSQFG